MRTRILVVIVALVLGGLAAVMAARYLGSARSSIEAENEMVEVLVAQEDIPAGLASEDLVTRKLLVHEEIPRRFVAADAVYSVRAIEGQVLAVPLSKREQATKSRFQFPSQAGLSYTVPEDYVAVTIPSDEVRGVAGLIKPGDHVAVFVTIETTADRLSAVTKVIIPKARVLAVGTSVGIEAPQQATEGSSNGDSGVFSGNERNRQADAVPRTVTLALSIAQAERLVFSQERGEVWLALLPTNAVDLPATKGQTVKTVLK